MPKKKEDPDALYRSYKKELQQRKHAEAVAFRKQAEAWSSLPNVPRAEALLTYYAKKI
jgi:hypothetical protein